MFTLGDRLRAIRDSRVGETVPDRSSPEVVQARALARDREKIARVIDAAKREVIEAVQDGILPSGILIDNVGQPPLTVSGNYHGAFLTKVYRFDDPLHPHGDLFDYAVRWARLNGLKVVVRDQDEIARIIFEPRG